MELNDDFDGTRITKWEKERKSISLFMREYSVYGEEEEENRYSWNDYHLNKKKHSITIRLTE